MNREVLSVRRYKAGYEIRKELVDDSEYGGTGLIMKSAYTPSGDYIGDSKWGHRLCKKRGIKPEIASPNHTVCSIGFCEEEQKWYGWSHRAIFGFSVGSVCKLGDCGYRPSNKKEFLDSLAAWYDDGLHDSVKLSPNDAGVQIDCVSKGGLGHSDHEPYPDEWGRGEWVAESLEDAKQMAIDFARGVS